MRDLIGRRIIEIIINQEKDLILFKTDAGDFWYQAYGDCCSNSWIEHISNLDSLIGNKVDGIDENFMGELEKKQDDDGYYGECVQIYKTSLKTDKGVCDIEYRNSSNGYYGGSLNRLKIPPESYLRTPQNFKEITEDF